MIEKATPIEPMSPMESVLLEKINEIIDTVNTIQKEREAERFEIQEWIGIVEDLRKQFSKLQHDNSEKANSQEPADPYAEQRKWIGCLCRFWFDNKKQADLGILGSIDDYSFHPYFNADLGCNYKYCEPVKPDDSIIYKGDNNE